MAPLSSNLSLSIPRDCIRFLIVSHGASSMNTLSGHGDCANWSNLLMVDMSSPSGIPYAMQLMKFDLSARTMLPEFKSGNNMVFMKHIWSIIISVWADNGSISIAGLNISGVLTSCRRCWPSLVAPGCLVSLDDLSAALSLL